MKWVKSKVLGKGSYGTVSLAEPVPGFSNPLLFPSVLAVKSADMVNCSSLLKEGKIMDQLRCCPHVVTCYGYDTSVEDGKKMYNLLLEYAPGGTLADLIHAQWEHGFVSEFEVSMYAYMLLEGLDHIHGKGYVHCDLKPSNILVFPCADRDGNRVNRLKIADFGLAKKAQRRAGMRRCGKLYKVRGTPLYGSPESVLMGVNEWPLDIWSLGCVLIEIFTGKSAYEDSQPLGNLLEQIATEEELPEIPCFVSEIGQDFLTKCLIRDPRERWTATELLNHQFIVDNLKKLHCQHRALLSWEEGSVGRIQWWSGESSFTTFPVPTPIRYAPHLSNKQSSSEQLSPTPARFLLPHQLYSKDHPAAGPPSPTPARFLLPHQLYSKDHAAAGPPSPTFFLPHQLYSRKHTVTGPPARILRPHQICSKNQAAALF